jgi:lysophospholipase L1-like esterase
MFMMKSRPAFACWLFVPLILGCSMLARRGVDGQESLRPKIMLQNSDRIVTFGDSVTRLAFCPAAPNCNFTGDGWATMLKRDLEAQGLTQEIISAGVGGDTTVDLLARVQRDVLDKKPTVVTLMVGLNDTWRYARDEALNPDKKGSITPPQYETNLRELVAAVKESGARLILCTPSLMGEDPRKFDDPKDGMNARLNAYSESVRRIAAEENVQLLDVRRAFTEKEREINTQQAHSGVLTINDGVHLNEKGQRFMADLMLGALQGEAAAQ